MLAFLKSIFLFLSLYFEQFQYFGPFEIHAVLVLFYITVWKILNFSFVLIFRSKSKKILDVKIPSTTEAWRI